MLKLLPPKSFHLIFYYVTSAVDTELLNNLKYTQYLSEVDYYSFSNTF
jgi:hypothetical protein